MKAVFLVAIAIFLALCILGLATAIIAEDAATPAACSTVPGVPDWCSQ